LWAKAEISSLVADRARAIRPASAVYRPDIDGLRAIAILAVLTYHAFPGKAPGGFAGVDVFFVISGFLITGILERRLARENYRLRDFYAARIRRIFPALILVLLATLAAGWCILLEPRFQALGRHVAASAVFSANLIFWKEINYFNVFGSQGPLLHLWSIGVEEQFYLAWPLILLIAGRLRIGFAATAGAIAVASFAWCLWLTGHDPNAAFYSPLSRGWELMLGALVALLPLQVRGRHSTFLSLVGLCAIVAAFALLNAEDPYPGWRATVPCLGTALLIIGGREGAVNRFVLSQPLMVAIGLISYPLYLWHYPLLSFASIWQFGATPSRMVRLALLATSFLLAFATYRWIETLPQLRRRVGVPQLLAAMTLCFAAGLAVARDGIPGRPITRDVRRRFVMGYAEFVSGRLGQVYRQECSFYDVDENRSRTSIEPRCTMPGTSATVFLWGDSHAQALSWGLRKLLPRDVGIAQVATSDCPPAMQHVQNSLGPSCDRSNAFAMRSIARLKPQVVVLAQKEGHENTDWNALARWAHLQGAQRVVLVGPAPEWLPSLPEVVVASHWGKDDRRVATGLLPATFETDRILAARYARSPQLDYVSLVGRLCDASGCLAQVPGSGRGTLMAVDDGHLSPQGSVYIAREILVPELQRRAGEPKQPGQ
jgi:peptidoglycan/LPS O-acetylase OafA/YrhL